MKESALTVSTIVLAVAILGLPPAAGCQRWPSSKLAPYVPSPKDAGERILQMAAVTKADVLYDLGAGDGRLVVLAAQKFGATAVGVEIDQELCATAQQRLRELGLQKKARVLCADLMTVDLSDATVVTLYLTTLANAKVRPNLEKYLRPGARVVSYAFEIPGWKPLRTEVFRLKTEGFKDPRSSATIYLYVR